jgi:hypothetical protein
MVNTRIGRRTPWSLLVGWSAALLAAGAVGLWLWLARGDGPALLAAEALAIAVPLLAVWLWRARSARRWSAAVNAYADREIARARRLAARRQAPAVAALADGLNHRHLA